MQSTLVEVKSASDIFRMKIESHSNKLLYNKCIKLMESGDRLAAAELIRLQDFKKDSTLCMLLCQCICPRFPYQDVKEFNDVDLEEIEEIPSDLSNMLDEAEDRSDSNLDKITQDYFDRIPTNLDGKAESLALHLVEIAANLGDEIARRDLLVYCENNSEYLENNLFLFYFVDIMEKGEIEKIDEWIDYCIETFKENNLIESAYFYCLIKKQLFHLTYDDYRHQSMSPLLTQDQKDEVKKDVEIYFKNKMIVSKHSVLRTDYLESVV